MIISHAGLQMQTFPTYSPMGPYAQREPYTPKGVRWCMTAFLIYLAVLATQIVYGCWVALSLGNITSGSTSYFFGAMSTAYLGITAVLTLLVLVFYLIGFGHFYGGKNELGAERARRLDISLYLIVASIVAAVVGSFIILALQLGNLTFPYYWHPEPGVFYVIAAANAITGTLVGAFVAAAIALPVHGLVDQGKDKQLYLAVALGTATSGVVAAVTILQLPSIVDALVDGVGSLSLSSGLPTVVSGLLGIMTFTLFFLLYWNVSRRIASGVLKPTAPPKPLAWVPLQVVPVYPIYAPVVPMQPMMPPPVPPPEPPKQASVQQYAEKKP